MRTLPGISDVDVLRNVRRAAASRTSSVGCGVVIIGGGGMALALMCEFLRWVFQSTQVELWCGTAGTFLLILFLFRWRERRLDTALPGVLQEMGRCTACGCLLKGASRCPECGQLADRRPARSEQRDAADKNECPG